MSGKSRAWRLRLWVGFGLLAVVGWLMAGQAVGWCQEKQGKEVEAKQPAANSGERKMEAFGGTVVNEAGEPIAGAFVFLSCQTVAQGFKQREFNAKTDERGRFEFKECYPLGELSRVRATAYQPGYAFQFVYHQNIEGKLLEGETFRLKKATPVRLRLLNTKGEEIRQAVLSPFQRMAADGSQHIVAMQAINRTRELQTVADDQGRIALDVLAAGDRATIIVRSPAGLHEATFAVGEGGDIDVTVPDPKGRPTGGAPQPMPPPGEPPAPERVAWVAKHAVPIASLDPAGTDFADLQALKTMIGDARIVMLGEQSHGDGAAFLAKTRLIRFLHEQMDFDVLAFESGLYDCRRAWQAYRDGMTLPVPAARQGIFSIWSNSQQLLPLMHYLAARARTDRPLELAGFDDQLTGLASTQHLAEDIRAVAARLGEPVVDADTVKTLTETIPIISQPGKKIEKEQLAAFQAACDKIGRAASDAAESGGEAAEEFRFWGQFFQSLRHFATRAGTAGWDGFSLRDQQMGRNMIWLAKTAYPKRKIIVWAASLHIAANPRTIRFVGGADPYATLSTMGQEVRSGLGAKEMFVVGLLSGGGQAAPWFSAPKAVSPPPAGSLEDIFVRAGNKAALLDLRQREGGGDWLAEPQVASFLGYGSPQRADWSQVFDGVLFIPEMQPSTRIGGAAAQAK